MFAIVETVNDLCIIFITFDKKYLFDTEKGGLHHVYSNILFCLISFPFNFINSVFKLITLYFVEAFLFMKFPTFFRCK